MSGPTNAVVGDMEDPTSVPVTQVPDEALIEEQKMAKYSKTKEFKRLKEFMEGRIKFFQTFLPDGTSINKLNEADDTVIAAHWRAATIVIGELKYILDTYENASEAASLGRQD